MQSWGVRRRLRAGVLISYGGGIPMSVAHRTLSTLTDVATEPPSSPLVTHVVLKSPVPRPADIPAGPNGAATRLRPTVYFSRERPQSKAAAANTSFPADPTAPLFSVPLSDLGTAQPLFKVTSPSCTYFAVRLPLIKAGFKRVGDQETRIATNVAWSKSWTPAPAPGMTPPVKAAASPLAAMLSGELAMTSRDGFNSLKSNHFSGSHGQLGCKSGMWKNIEHAIRRCPEEGAPFEGLTPATWRLPEDYEALRQRFFTSDAASPTDGMKLIVKPSRGSCGRGIQMISSTDPAFEKLCALYAQAEGASKVAGSRLAAPTAATPLRVVQQYVGNPLLIDNRKFDFRLYVAVTSFDPLVVYLHEEGLVRFAADAYQPGLEADRTKHLTNYSVGRHLERRARIDYMLQHKLVPSFEEYRAKLEADRHTSAPAAAVPTSLPGEPVKEYEDARSYYASLHIPRQVAELVSMDLKWPLSKLAARISSDFGLSAWAGAKSQIEAIIVKTLIAAQKPIVEHSHRRERYHDGSFELFGFDIMLDADMKAWLIEVNTLPSLESSSSLDYQVKSQVVTDLMNLAGIPLFDRSPNDFAALQATPEGSVPPPTVPPCKSAWIAAGVVHPVVAASQEGESSMATLLQQGREDPTEDAWKQVERVHQEEQYKGGFQRIFPTYDRIAHQRYPSLFDADAVTQRSRCLWAYYGGRAPPPPTV